MTSQPGPDPATPQTASQRRAATQAKLAAMRARKRRRDRLIAAGAIIAAVVVLVAAGIAIGLHSGSGGGSGSMAADKGVVSAVTTIPAATYDKVGAGSGLRTKPQRITAPALTADGKPRVLYVGAEYCPFCAAERWAVVAALSRFGTFTDLGQTSSASDDIYPDTATLSFHGAHYTSRFLSFTGVEIQSNKRTANGYAPLDTLAPADEKILDTYDKKSYTGAGTNSIPFLDLGGRYVSAGATYDPQVLAGMTHQEVADAIGDPSTDVAKAVVGTANLLTAHLCELTGQKPADVCTSAGVTAAK